MTYKVAEFFSGCGGFSRGFSLSGRFSTVFANDIKPEALATFAYNHRESEVLPDVVRQDIRTLPLSEIVARLEARGVAPGDLDCLVGGPPCQGFSQLRRSEERNAGQLVKFRGYSKLSEDPRNDLVLRYLEVAETLKPKFILIENVPQMLSHGFEGRLGQLSETVVEILERDLGYSVAVKVLVAADYGVPQLRERAFFIARANGQASFPSPTHADPTALVTNGLALKPWVTVREAFEGLPQKLIAGQTIESRLVDQYQPTDSDFGRQMKSIKQFPSDHVTRTYRESVLNLIREMRPGQTWDSESLRMRNKYEKMTCSLASRAGISVDAAFEELVNAGRINKTFYKKYYWSAYTRLSWAAPSLTVTANANFLGSGRFTHPEEMRGITIREAARLQSFDDDFDFICSTRGDNFESIKRIGIAMDMIGEAVPPLLAKSLAIHIADQLDAGSA
jgi:DNA (cytosine-5)-methyltransferase 1